MQNMFSCIWTFGQLIPSFCAWCEKFLGPLKRKKDSLFPRTGGPYHSNLVGILHNYSIIMYINDCFGLI